MENICSSDIYFNRTIVIFRIRVRYVFMKLFSLFSPWYIWRGDGGGGIFKPIGMFYYLFSSLQQNKVAFFKKCYMYYLFVQMRQELHCS